MDDATAPSPLSLHNSAIDAALESRWKDALGLNSQILKTEPENIDALNRTARAYFELGNLSQAQKYYNAVAKIDPYNPIAQKNLKIIKAFKKNGDSFQPLNVIGDGNTKQEKISPSLFLQEPGKTKVVNLLKVAEPQKLSVVYCGMPVGMVIKNHSITIQDTREKYLGVLPDDLSFQIIRLLRGGNQYQAFVKSVRVNGLAVLIRETFRSKKFRNQPSFLDNHNYQNTDIITNLNSLDQDEENDSPDDTEEPVI